MVLENLQQSLIFSEWTRLGNVASHTKMYSWRNIHLSSVEQNILFFKSLTALERARSYHNYKEVYKLQTFKVQVYFCLVISVESVSPKSLY